MEFSSSERRGMLVVPNAVQRGAPAAEKRARETTLGCKGAKIFNLLPAWIRNINCVTAEKFKSELDLFLGGVPDQPTVPGRHRAATTNSLLDQLQMII